MEQPTQAEQTQEVAAPAAAALPTPSQGKKCMTFKKVKNLPANRGPRKRTCSSRRRKCSSKKRSSRRRKAAKRSRRRRKAKKAKKGKKRCGSKRRRVVRRKARKAC